MHARSAASAQPSLVWPSRPWPSRVRHTPPTGTISVPDDFNPAYSDTRATGHYDGRGTGLRVWTEGNTSTDKVAEYVDTTRRWPTTGEPTLNYTPTSGTIPPGFQLVVDFDGDGTTDGILVGEQVYYGNWWLNNAAQQFVKAGAPSTRRGLRQP